jgi:hypothetical protein
MNNVEAMLFCSAVGNLCMPMQSETFSSLFYTDYLEFMKKIKSDKNLQENRALLNKDIKLILTEIIDRYKKIPQIFADPSFLMILYMVGIDVEGKDKLYLFNKVK